MSRFLCPDCGGGFPEPAIPGEDPTENGCPWCGYQFDTLRGVTEFAEVEK